MKQALFIITFISATLGCAAQTVPADFIAGSVYTSTYEKLDGFIKENLKKDGSIAFINAQGQKKAYNVGSLQSFTINNITYLSYLNDFYKTIVTGSRLSLYQKVTDNNGKLINNGTESVVATTTDGRIGDYYLQSKKDSDLTLITKKNFQESVMQVCADCTVVVDNVKTKQVDYSQLVKVVEQYNNCMK
jgi:hypothetical protein